MDEKQYVAQTLLTHQMDNTISDDNSDGANWNSACLCADLQIFTEIARSYGLTALAESLFDMLRRDVPDPLFAKALEFRRRTLTVRSFTDTVGSSSWDAKSKLPLSCTYGSLTIESPARLEARRGQVCSRTSSISAPVGTGRLQCRHAPESWTG